MPSKLTSQNREAILSKKGKQTASAVAKEFGVNVSTISRMWKQGEGVSESKEPAAGDVRSRDKMDIEHLHPSKRRQIVVETDHHSFHEGVEGIIDKFHPSRASKRNAEAQQQGGAISGGGPAPKKVKVDPELKKMQEQTADEFMAMMATSPDVPPRLERQNAMHLARADTAPVAEPAPALSNEERLKQKYMKLPHNMLLARIDVLWSKKAHVIMSIIGETPEQRSNYRNKVIAKMNHEQLVDWYIDTRQTIAFTEMSQMTRQGICVAGDTIEWAGETFLGLDLEGYGTNIRNSSEVSEISDDIALDNYEHLCFVAHNPWMRLAMTMGQGALQVDAINRVKKMEKKAVYSTVDFEGEREEGGGVVHPSFPNIVFKDKPEEGEAETKEDDDDL